MRIQISEIKINPGRRKTSPQYVEELARSITAVGLLNPVTIDQNNVLIAGLHRLEAAKMLGWSEIECTVNSVDSLQAELAEIDENFVRSRLSNSELSEQLLRRKEIYETLHPETRQGKRNGQTAKKENSSLLAVKPFSQDTAEKMGVSKRTVEQLVQTARDLTPEAKEILRNTDRKITKTDALKISRLPPDQQQETAARLAAGGSKPLVKPPTNPSSGTHEDVQQSEAIEGLVKEFFGYAHRFISGMKTYKNLSETFAEMSTLQITVIWDAVAAVNKALRDFSKEVKNINLEMMKMKTDYMTEGYNLPPYLLYPLFLLNMDLRLTAKMIYCVLLDMIINSDESVQRDSLDRYYLAVSNKTIARKIDRTPTTVAQALIELENADLAERKWVGRNVPCHIYVKLP